MQPKNTVVSSQITHSPGTSDVIKYPGFEQGGGGVMHCGIFREGHRRSVVMSKRWNFLMIDVGRYGLQ